MPLGRQALAAACNLRWNFIRLASPAQCTSRATAASTSTSTSTVPTAPTVPTATAAATVPTATAAVADATALPAAALALSTTTARVATVASATAAVADATALPAAALALATSALVATIAAAARSAEPVLLPDACQLRESHRRLLPQRRGRVPGMLRLATPATSGATARGPALATSTVTTTLASNATRRPALASFTAASMVRWASRQNMRRMSHNRLRRLGGRSLVQWRMHLGQSKRILYDDITTALATSTVTTTLASNATDAAAAAFALAAAAAVVKCRSRAVCARGRSGSGRARVDR